ncbi:hypothetical protein Gpo141_00009615 [Globisporangium polare]
MAPNSSGSSSSGSSDSSGTVGHSISGTTTSSSPAGTLPSKAVSSRQEDTCGCGPTPRTCHECLNVLLANGNSCVVSPLGVCMSASDAAVLSSQQRTNTTPSGDSASNSSVIPQSNEFFSSSNATYCDAGDATCAACRVQWIDGYQKDALRSKAKFSCIGGGGCVCTAYYRHERQLRAQRRAQQQQRNEATRSRVVLTLEGWTGYRGLLIEREQASLGLKSAPLLTDAPTQVVVQEGEGFRPASPSRVTRQQQSRIWW